MLTLFERHWPYARDGQDDEVQSIQTVEYTGQCRLILKSPRQR